ncbi:uncharacterized protein LOC114526511 [Dendronephthya gigantea]|uniref:uncharacterized protein LOC114526511 n=1 Tax=Dendronephthya gigantea TaxID=151771 RepID=UPI00106C4F87|nr:uncharacterized protein LOC114526511 [Dendronephthya gigantea]
MSRKSAGKRKKNEDEHLDSIIDEINTITGAESSKSRKTRPDHSSKNKDIDIVLRRDESGQRIYHNPRRLSQSSWARRGSNITANKEGFVETDSVNESNPESVEYTRLNEPVDLLTDKVDEHSETFEQDLDAIIEQCEEAVGEMNDNTTVWQKRINNLEENWENARGAIFHSVLCSFAPPTSSLHCSKIDCPNDAQLRCKQCGVFQYLCVNCDEEVHQCQPLHDREVWINGYFQYILPTESITDDGKLVPVGRACPLLYPTSCLVCGESTLKTLNSSKVILITSEGRFDLNWFNIHCYHVLGNGHQFRLTKEDSSCGDTHWKAAKAVSKAKKNQDETGLTEKKLADAKTELATYAREINLSDADLDASVVSWKRDVQQFATGTTND